MEPMRSFKATSTRLSHKTVSQEKLDERHNALYNELDEQGKSLHDRVFEEKARPVYRNTAFSVYIYIHRLRRHWHDTSRLLEKPMTMANQSSFFLVLLSSATTRAMLLLHWRSLGTSARGSMLLFMWMNGCPRRRVHVAVLVYPILSSTFKQMPMRPLPSQTLRTNCLYVSERIALLYLRRMQELVLPWPWLCLCIQHPRHWPNCREWLARHSPACSGRLSSTSSC